MTQLFHITNDGPKKCTASVVPCRYGAQDHKASFEEAMAIFEERNLVVTSLSASDIGKSKTDDSLTSKVTDDISKELFSKLKNNKKRLLEIHTELEALSANEEKYLLALDYDNDLTEINDVDFTDAHFHRDLSLYSIARDLRRFDELYPNVLSKDLNKIKKDKLELLREKENCLKSVELIESKLN